jgi:hypothetical protein
MKNFIIQYWLAFVFGLIVTGGGVWYKRFIKRVCNQRSLQNGTQALLRNQIIHSYDKYIEQGWMPIYAKETLLEMYKAYHGLGGNGVITDLVEGLRELPSKKPDDKQEGEGA